MHLNMPDKYRMFASVAYWRDSPMYSFRSHPFLGVAPRWAAWRPVATDGEARAWDALEFA